MRPPPKPDPSLDSGFNGFGTSSKHDLMAFAVVFLSILLLAAFSLGLLLGLLASAP